MNIRDFERILPPSQQWENLTLANDFVFGKIMHNSELCAEMMRRILPGLDIGRIEFTQPQKYEKFSLDTRGVRFDVYAKSDNRKIFDCEVQTSNKKDLPQRTRAYHSLIGIKALEKRVLKDSGSYIDMPDVFVIFICTFDPFNRGRHIYSFSNVCSEVDGLELNDGARTVFLNTKGRADDVNGELKALLDFVMGISSDDPFIRRLEEELNKLKQNLEWRQEYMLASLRDWERRSEARAEGFEEGLNAAAEFMRRQGMSDEQINTFRTSVLMEKGEISS